MKSRSRRKLVVATPCLALAVSATLAKAQALISPSQTTYQYTSIPNGAPVELDPAGTDAGLISAPGSGQLNDGLFGSNDWLAVTPDVHPFAFEGNGQSGGIIFHGSGAGMTITFNLGNTYSLTNISLGLVDDVNEGVSVPQIVTVSDGTVTHSDYTFQGQVSGSLNGQQYYSQAGGYGGAYIQDNIDLTSLGMRGSTITVTLQDTAWQNGGNYDDASGWIGLNEIEFTGNLAGAPQWNKDSTGDWSITTNWQGGIVPNAAGAEADLFGAISHDHTIGIDNTPVTLGTLNFNNSHTYTIAGNSSLTMQTSSGDANIIVQQGTGNISVALIMASNTTLNVAPSATLNISGPLTVNSGVSVSQTGGGTVNYSNVVTLMSNAAMAFGNTTANTLNVSSGAVASVTGTGTTLNVYNLNLAGGTLDVNKNQVNINYNTTPFTGGPDPVDTVRAKLLSGYAGGLWNGTGITSSAAAADPGHGIGYADNGSTVTLKYTLAGDATMDGTVNFNDLLALAGSYTSTTAHWTSGDFNYDGTVNFSDLLLLAGTYTQTLTANPGSGISSSFAADWALAEAEVAAVPEPASLGILAIGAIGLMNRRRRT